MAYLKVWIHYIWTTKYKEPLIKPVLLHPLIQHMYCYAKSKSICIESINGYADHMHMLVRLNSTQTIAKTAQLLKGESARWLNNQASSNNQLFNGIPFEWQRSYYALSVGEAELKRINRYIKNQELQHTLKELGLEYAYAEDIVKKKRIEPS
jgi:putative transposase